MKVVSIGNYCSFFEQNDEMLSYFISSSSLLYTGVQFVGFEEVAEDEQGNP